MSVMPYIEYWLDKMAMIVTGFKDLGGMLSEASRVNFNKLHIRGVNLFLKVFSSPLYPFFLPDL